MSWKVVFEICLCDTDRVNIDFVFEAVFVTMTELILTVSWKAVFVTLTVNIDGVLESCLCDTDRVTTLIVTVYVLESCLCGVL